MRRETGAIMPDAALVQPCTDAVDAQRFAALFGTRRDAYGIEASGRGQWIKEPLTEAVIRQHLRGDIRIGIPSLESGGNEVTCGCIDLDVDAPDQAFDLHS